MCLHVCVFFILADTLQYFIQICLIVFHCRHQLYRANQICAVVGYAISYTPMPCNKNLTLIYFTYLAIFTIIIFVVRQEKYYHSVRFVRSMKYGTFEKKSIEILSISRSYSKGKSFAVFVIHRQIFVCFVRLMNKSICIRGEVQST